MDIHTSIPNIEPAVVHQLDAPDVQYEVTCKENTSSLQQQEPPTSQNQSPLSLKKPRRRPTPRALLYPHLEIETILAWADAHYARVGSWPSSDSGRIPETSGDNWSRIDAALIMGLRGLTGGSSLARLLALRRGKRNRKALPPLSIETILTWADAHHERTGAWPMRGSGKVEDAPGETWMGVEMALAHKQRGLPGGSSLALLLQEARGRQHMRLRSRLTLARILAWADAHYERTGEWPNVSSGVIHEATDENWSAVHGALNKGLRGLPGGSSLAQLLDEQRGVRNRLRLPELTVQQILTWADAHHTRTGRWPISDSGVVEDAPQERWSAINTCLIQGNRTLPGGSSLAQLLLTERSVRHRQAHPILSEAQIVAWAQSFHAHHSHPPRVSSGAVTEAPEETWSNLNNLLRQGQRGIKGGSSLYQLLLQAHPEWFTPLKPQTTEG